MPLQIVRNQFRLHRADQRRAARRRPCTLLKPGERVHDRFIVRDARPGARAKAKSWVDPADARRPAAATSRRPRSRPAGTLLLGLRFPVTEAGEPILVEIAGVAGMFDDDAAYLAVGRRRVRADRRHAARRADRLPGAVGPPRRAFDAVVGSIDATGKGSVLLDDHPMGGDVTSRHVRFRLPEPSHEAAGELVADLAPFHNVEGLAEVDGVRYYVTDEDHRVALWVD